MLALVLLAAVAPPLYRAVVAAQVRRLFGQLNRGNWHAVNDRLAGEFSYRFHGDTALGGVKRRRATMETWWRRVFAILPNARFEATDVLVAGPPWATRVAVDATISGDLADGTPYTNVFRQKIVLRLGRVVSIETVEDTQRLERALRALGAAGVPEALAAPLND